MSNLLPEKQRQLNTRLFTLQYVYHVFVLIALFVLVAMVSMLGIYVYVHKKYATMQIKITQLQRAELLPDSTAIGTIRQKTEKLEKVFLKNSPMFSASSIAGVTPAGVSVSSITTNDSSVLVAGTAKTESTFLQFIATIKKAKTIVVTESHYVRSDGTFLITGTVQ